MAEHGHGGTQNGFRRGSNLSSLAYQPNIVTTIGRSISHPTLQNVAGIVSLDANSKRGDKTHEDWQ